MKAYIDSSVLIRIAFRSPNPLHCVIPSRVDGKESPTGRASTAGRRGIPRRLRGFGMTLVVFATHDKTLARAAGFEVLGV